MKKLYQNFFVLPLAAWILISFLPLNVPGQWKTKTAAKDKSEMRYEVVHTFHTVEGICKELNCTIHYIDSAYTIVQTSFSADVTSFNSGNSNRDSHAMEALDALTYPVVLFHSTRIKDTGAALDITGNLTFHGITKEISFPARKDFSSHSLTVSGNAALSLTAFQIERPSLLFIPINDTLRISFTVVFP